MSTRLSLFALIAGVALHAPIVHAYEGGPVTGTGTVKGTVTLKGTPVATEGPAALDKLEQPDRDFCGAQQPLTASFYALDSSGHLKDVVVWLDGIEKGKPAPAVEGRLENEGCRFQPHVQTIQVGADLVVTNEDPILHNTHTVYARDKSTAFNIALPLKGQTIRKKIRRAGIIKAGCDAGHVWMRSWVHAFDHPYHAVSAADGSFALTDVPPGRYTLKIWHEAAGFTSQEVEVAPGGAVSVALTLDVNPKHKAN